MRQNYKKFASKRCFGVEIEATPTLSSKQIVECMEQLTRRKIRSSGWQPTQNNDWWHLKTDATCGGDDYGWGWELATFIASGSWDLAEIARVADSLRKAGLRVNQSCGLHVHVDVSDFDPEDIGVLSARWLKIEKTLFHCVPKRRVGNVFCRTRQTKFDKNPTALDIWEKLKPKKFGLTHNQEKWFALNLLNYYDTYRDTLDGDRYSRCTVEFRFPEGTLSGEDIRNWVRLFVLFVDQAKQAKMPRNLEEESDLDFVTRYFGLDGYNLSPGLAKTKRWLYRRFITHARDKKIEEQARVKLDRITLSYIQ